MLTKTSQKSAFELVYHKYPTNREGPPAGNGGNQLLVMEGYLIFGTREYSINDIKTNFPLQYE